MFPGPAAEAKEEEVPLRAMVKTGPCGPAEGEEDVVGVRAFRGRGGDSFAQSLLGCVLVVSQGGREGGDEVRREGGKAGG
jgi:hypothetical protein